jgi:manganese-dependent inorganic pyrophosphatase
MSTIYLFGHKNPDNDCILSSVILSQLLNATDDGNTYVARRLGPLPPESAKLLAECGFDVPELLESIPEPVEGEERMQVLLCDHNESAQSVDGLYNAEVLGAVDHHRIGDFHTTAPAFYICLPWGSTCSIVYYLFGLYGVEPTPEQQKCLLSAMLTDMVMLKSPTTTDHDRTFVKEISERLGIDPMAFGMEIFNARPALSPDRMVSNDIKEFEVAGKRLLIGQYETVNKKTALDQLDELHKAMDDYRQQKGADGLVLCVTDIMEEGSQVLMCGDTAAAEKGLGIENVYEGVWMPGVLSRKKQVAAPILANA